MKTVYVVSKQYLLLLLSVVFILSVAGCSNDDKEFKVMIYSNIPSEAKEEIETNLTQVLDESFDELEVNILPVFRERLIVEIAAHEGDVYLIERELLSTILYPDGLYPLDEIQNVEDIENGSELQGEDENGNIHLYAVPVGVTKLYPEWQYDPGHELLAVVPVYSDYQEEAFRIIRELVKED